MVHIFLFLFLLSGSFGIAQEKAPRQDAGVASAEKLDNSIENVLSRPEYSWRMPRERPQAPELKLGFLETFFSKIYEWAERAVERLGKLIEKIMDWIEAHMKRKPGKRNTDMDWQFPLQAMLFFLLLIAGVLLGIQLYRLWRNRKAAPQVVAEAVRSVPDLTEENISADELPSDEWLKLAADLIARGEFRLALRAMFLGCLAELARRRVITVAMCKSNREYIAELRRRAHDRPEMLSAFETNVRMLERIWYGTHSADETILSDFRSNQTRILSETQNK